MAHAARISELTGSLFQSVAGDRSQHASFLRMRDQASKTFRNATHARTNQFDVRSKLTGLVEKFAVLNRDDLADALQTRLDVLPPESKWMPEILSLLLQLSDRPLEKTRIEDVEALSKPEDEQPGLTWDDIIADDPLDEIGIWDSIERGYHSSGDDAAVDGDAGSDGSDSTQATSIEDNTIALARLHIEQPDEQLLDEFLAVRDVASSSMSELSVVRESLSMLHGLPSNVYEINESSGDVSVRQGANIETAAKSTINGLLVTFAESGTALNRLRQWIRIPEDTPYLQSCQAAAFSTLIEFDRQIATIEQRYAAPLRNTMVSLIDIRGEVEVAARPLLHLSRILNIARDGVSPSPFAVFDGLYDEICVSEMSGDGLLGVLANVFLAGLKTYLRSLSRWIQAGTLDRSDTTFMIREANSECELGRFWHDRFALRIRTDGKVCAPRFMHPLSQRIFAIGKGRAFLHALGDCEDLSSVASKNNAYKIDSLEDRLETAQLLPFSQLLEDSLEAWIEESSRDTTPILHQKVLHEQGLLQTVDRLEEVFCSKNGIHFQAFAETLFWRMDHQPDAWSNNFVLSELAQSALGNDADMESLTIRVAEAEESAQPQSTIKQLESVVLETTFSWQVQNIMQSRTSATHAKAFILFLQTYRASSLLQQNVLDLKHFASHVNNITSKVQSALRLRQRLICFVEILHAYIASTAHTIHDSLKSHLTAAADINAMAAVWTTHIKHMDTALLLAPKFSAIREAVTTCLELCEQLAPLWAGLVDSCTTSKNRALGEGEEDVKKDERDEGGQDSPAESDFLTTRTELDKSLSFLLAGVRSIGRVSGNKMLEELAERLEWMMQ